ncbi:MAG: hypothetical protein MZV64_70610 [Ignavibacteriales bacterium]|nr:hypothetical protein [Ignavibacteriales bacterium]
MPITASGVLEELAAPRGFQVLRTKIAPRSLMEAATQDGVVFVGDAFGGFIFPQFQPAFDAMLATLKILEMLAVSELEVSPGHPPHPRAHPDPDQVPCPWERKGAVMRTLIEATKHENVELRGRREDPLGRGLGDPVPGSGSARLPHPCGGGDARARGADPGDVPGARARVAGPRGRGEQAAEKGPSAALAYSGARCGVPGVRLARPIVRRLAPGPF